MYCCIYKIVNNINDKIYVGQTWKTLQDRFSAHKNINDKHCVKLHNAFNKHGRDNFEIKLITICATQEVADYWETYFINKYDTIKNGYNIRSGGSRGKHSEATKKKMSEAALGKIKSEEHRKNLSISHIGNPGYWSGKTRVINDEWAEAISIASKGKKKPPRTKEHIDNLSKSLKGLNKGSTWKVIDGKRVWIKPDGSN